MKIKCPDCSTSYEIKTDALGPEGRSVKCAKCGNRWFVDPKDEEDGPADFAAADDTTATVESSDEETEAKDEADWAADSEEDSADIDADGPETPPDDADEPEDLAVPPAVSSASADEGKFAADLADDDNGNVGDEGSGDIESSAKRPKINVDPNKFRRDHFGAIFNWILKRNFRRVGGIALLGFALAVCVVFVLMRDSIVKQSPDLASLFQVIGLEVNLRGLEFRNLHTFTEMEDGKSVLVVEGSIRNLLDDTNSVPAVRLSIRNSGLQEVYAWTVEPRTKSLNGLDETRFRTILADPPGDASDIQVRFVDRGKRQIVLE
jgi:predicted Zn finger-like uncharacterized protein